MPSIPTDAIEWKQDIKILATDGAVESLSASVNVTITIKQSRQSAPQFSSNQIRVNVPEDIPVGR